MDPAVAEVADEEVTGELAEVDRLRRTRRHRHAHWRVEVAEGRDAGEEVAVEDRTGRRPQASPWSSSSPAASCFA
jgi:hypothetical protein